MTQPTFKTSETTLTKTYNYLQKLKQKKNNFCCRTKPSKASFKTSRKIMIKDATL